MPKLKLNGSVDFPVSKYSIAGFFENYPVEEHYVKNNSAIIFGRSDRLWAHLIVDSLQDIKYLLHEHHRKCNYYHSVEEEIIPVLKLYGKPEWILRTILFILPEEKVKAGPDSETILLKPSHAEYIYKNSAYREYTSKAYIRNRLQKDVSAGIIKNNQLIAWALTHDDGSLGFLNVLPGYRNRGYAKRIVKQMIWLKQKNEQPVFTNIEPENYAAIKLSDSLGFISSGFYSWIKISWK